MDQRIGLITLGVADLSRAKDFLPGARVAADPDSPDDVAFFRRAGWFSRYGTAAKLAEDSARSRLRRLGRGDSGLQRALSRARSTRSSPRRKRRVRVIGREPARAFWGGFSAVFIDPDGHPWEVAHNPGWTLGEDGSVSLAG